MDSKNTIFSFIYFTIPFGQFIRTMKYENIIGTHHYFFIFISICADINCYLVCDTTSGYDGSPLEQSECRDKYRISNNHGVYDNLARKKFVYYRQSKENEHKY